MPDLKPIVALTSINVEKMSRHELLEWVNTTVGASYKKVEELCSGVAYCQMVEALYPNSIGIKKVKVAAKLELEFIHNLKLLQNAFTRLKFDKSIPIDRLVKGRFQDNLEFLQWFKKFYDSQNVGKENRKISQNIPNSSASNNLETQPTNKQQLVVKTPKSGLNDNNPVSPNSVRVLEETRDQLIEQVQAIEYERNYYYKKLTDIEALLNESAAKKEHVDWCQRMLGVLYAEDNVGDGPSAN